MHVVRLLRVFALFRDGITLLRNHFRTVTGITALETEVRVLRALVNKHQRVLLDEHPEHPECRDLKQLCNECLTSTSGFEE